MSFRIQKIRSFVTKLHLTATLVYIISTSRCYSDTSETRREYCVYERFVARCSDDDVINVTSALYGRMRARRCITSDYEHTLGCYSDVTAYVSSLCSGRQLCSVLVATMDSVVQPCTKDFKSYLETTYQCLKVSFLDGCENNESNNTYRHLTESTSPYLALYPSFNSLGRIRPETLHPCPWIIQVPSGQTITVSWGFDYPSSPNVIVKSLLMLQNQVRSNRICSTAEFKELELESSFYYDVCNKDKERGDVIYSSQTNSLRIRIQLNYETIDGAWDLIVWKYSVSGCRDLDLPTGTLVRRNGDTLVVMCNGTQQSWYLTCHSTGNWIGEIGNCSYDGLLRRVISARSSFKFTGGVMIAALIGLALGLLIGSALFAVFILKLDPDSSHQRVKVTLEPVENSEDCQSTYIEPQNYSTWPKYRVATSLHPWLVRGCEEPCSSFPDATVCRPCIVPQQRSQPCQQLQQQGLTPPGVATHAADRLSTTLPRAGCAETSVRFANQFNQSLRADEKKKDLL